MVKKEVCVMSPSKKKEVKAPTEAGVISPEKIKEVKALIEAAELALKNTNSSFADIVTIPVPTCDPKGCIIGCKKMVGQ
jgi:hypothetical protein